MWIALAVLLLFAALWLALILPARSTKAQRAPFVRRMFAHRGLFLADQSVPENSIPAFRAAVAAGYGVELDVQLTKDKVVVVFHDDDLKRVCGVDARVDAYTFAELQAFPLLSTGERIPTFSDVLAILDGKIPMIVELKSGGDWKTLCEKTLAAAAGIPGRLLRGELPPAAGALVLSARAADSARAALRGGALFPKIRALVSGADDEPAFHEHSGAPAVYCLPHRAKVPFRAALRGDGRNARGMDGTSVRRPSEADEAQ